jgi:hypothetical protein
MADAGGYFEQLIKDFCNRIWNPEHVRANHAVDGREIDIIIETPNEVVILECTTERGKRKAEHDIAKIREVRRSLVGDAVHKPVRGFFVTQPIPVIWEGPKANLSEKFHSSAGALSRWHPRSVLNFGPEHVMLGPYLDRIFEAGRP